MRNQSNQVKEPKFKVWHVNKTGIKDEGEKRKWTSTFKDILFLVLCSTFHITENIESYLLSTGWQRTESIKRAVHRAFIHDLCTSFIWIGINILYISSWMLLTMVSTVSISCYRKVKGRQRAYWHEDRCEAKGEILLLRTSKHKWSSPAESTLRREKEEKKHAEETSNSHAEPSVSLQWSRNKNGRSIWLAEPTGCVISETKVSQSKCYSVETQRTRKHSVHRQICELVYEPTVSQSISSDFLLSNKLYFGTVCVPGTKHCTEGPGGCIHAFHTSVSVVWTPWPRSPGKMKHYQEESWTI